VADEESEHDSTVEKKEEGDKKEHPNFEKPNENELTDEILERIAKRLGTLIRAKDVPSFDPMSGGQTFEAGAFKRISELLVTRAGGAGYFKFVKSEPYGAGEVITYVGKGIKATARLHGTTVEHMGECAPTNHQQTLVWKGNSHNFHQGECGVWGFDEVFEEKAWGYAYAVLRSHGIADCCLASVELNEERSGRKRSDQSRADKKTGRKRLRQFYDTSGEVLGFKHYVFPATELARTPERKFYGEGKPIEDSANAASEA
jgi:hypothetical protein